MTPDNDSQKLPPPLGKAPTPPLAQGTAPVREAASYSRIVRLLRVALPLGALAIILTMVIYSLLFSPEGAVSITFSGTTIEEGKIIMSEPRFVGSDDEGQTFEIVADRAFQDTAITERVTMEGVIADIMLKSGIGVHVAAKDGQLDTKNELLALTGPIVLQSSDGYQLHTDEVKADLAKGAVTGRSPIRAEGEFGALTANGFEVDRNEKRIRFIGNVRIRIEPQKAERP